MLVILTAFGTISSSKTSKKSFEELNVGNTASHKVLGEFGTATWCGYCKYAHGALKEIYKNDWHDFSYVSLVCDKNKHAYYRAVTDLGLTGYPTVFWDGDYTKNVGAGSIPAAIAAYNTSITTCGGRTVANIDVDISVNWQGSATMSITVTVKNNGGTSYSGYLRCYVTEITSSMGWIDTGGKTYTFAFLDYAFNKSISVSAGGTWSDTVSWDGSQHGDGYGNDYRDIEKDNMFIIASVFASSSGYVDETAQKRVGSNRPPNAPSNPNPEDEEIDVEIDPMLEWDGDDPDWFDSVYYDVYFEKDDPTPDELVSEDQKETEYDPGILEFESTYYWKIVSEDEHGESASGPVWSFTTRGNDPPNTPNNPDPGDGETDVSIDKILRWVGGDPDGDKTYYDVYFEAENPNPELVSENQTSRTYNPGQLDYETTYYWKIVAEDEFEEITEGPIWSFTSMAPTPDLDCIGFLQWTKVAAGATVEGDFKIENIGSPTSELYWKIDEYPEWGEWTFIPDHGDGLTPEDGQFIVEVTVVTPPEKNSGFTGEIKVININDPSDFDTIQVTLRTPQNKPIFINILERILKTFPNIFPILRQLL